MPIQVICLSIWKRKVLWSSFYGKDKRSILGHLVGLISIYRMARWIILHPVKPLVFWKMMPRTRWQTSWKSKFSLIPFKLTLSLKHPFCNDTFQSSFLRTSYHTICFFCFQLWDQSSLWLDHYLQQWCIRCLDERRLLELPYRRRRRFWSLFACW